MLEPELEAQGNLETPGPTPHYTDMNRPVCGGSSFLVPISFKKGLKLDEKSDGYIAIRSDKKSL